MNELAKKDKPRHHFMHDQENALRNIAKDPRIMGRLIMIVIREMEINPKLAQCTPSSIISGALEAAKLGVEIGGSLAQSYLIPRSGKAVFQIAWRGLVKLMKEGNPNIEDVFAELVREGDEYELITPRQIKHKFDPFDEEREKKKIIGGYCRVSMRNGGYRDYFLSAKAIMKRRDVAMTTAIWDAWNEEMCEKTLVRYAAGRVDLAPVIQDQITHLDKMEVNLEPVDVPSEAKGNKAVLESLTEVPASKEEELDNDRALAAGEVDPEHDIVGRTEFLDQPPHAEDVSEALEKVKPKGQTAGEWGEGGFEPTPEEKKEASKPKGQTIPVLKKKIHAQNGQHLGMAADDFRHFMVASRFGKKSLNDLNKKELQEYAAIMDNVKERDEAVEEYAGAVDGS